MDYFTFSLGVPQVNMLGESIPLTFTITNISEFDIALLRRHTPLEGIKGSIFKVLDNNEKQLRYDGRLVKRGKPQKEEYQIIKKGDSLSKVIDLTNFYFFETAGDFTVGLDTIIRDFIILDNPKKKGLMGENTDLSQHLVSPEKSSFSIVKTEKPYKPTVGMVARMNEGRIIKLQDKVVSKKSKESGLPPKFVGGTTQQHKVIIAAQNKAFKFIQLSLKDLGSGGDKSQNYKRWFGQFSSFNYDTVYRIFNSLHNALRVDTVTYNLNGKGCEAGDFAYTFYQSRTIWLCSEFWLAENKGFNSQFGTIVHELTHALDDTEDIANGIIEAEELARKDALEAIDNADNYEYFSESL